MRTVRMASSSSRRRNASPTIRASMASARERADEPFERCLEHNLDKKVGDDDADEQRGNSRERDRDAREMPALLERVPFHPCGAVVRHAYRVIVSQGPAAIDDPRNTAGHHVEQRGNPAQQECRSKRELNGPSKLADVGLQLSAPSTCPAACVGCREELDRLWHS